jgi:hypothetical protein
LPTGISPLCGPLAPRDLALLFPQAGSAYRAPETLSDKLSTLNEEPEIRTRAENVTTAHLSDHIPLNHEKLLRSGSVEGSYDVVLGPRRLCYFDWARTAGRETGHHEGNLEDTNYCPPPDRSGGDVEGYESPCFVHWMTLSNFFVLNTMHKVG